MKIRYPVLKLMLALLLPLGAAANYLSSSNTTLTESLYSGSLYIAIARPLSQATGLLPFSAAELIVAALAVFVLWRLAALCIRIVRTKRGKLHVAVNTALNALALAGVVYIGFLLLWGFNYNRLSAAGIFGLDVRPSSPAELSELCSSLAGETNRLRTGLNENPDGVYEPADDYGLLFRKASSGFAAAAREFPSLGGVYGTPKPVLLSRLMSYTGIWGVYFPFTAEANVNVSIPPPMVLSTACHEMAHQRGLAREDEANFISYLACRANSDRDFQYSGTLRAMINCMGALWRVDREGYARIYSGLDDGVKRDIKAINAFNRKYEGPVERISSNINDLYLKANNQKEGVASYGRDVDLMLALYRKENGIR